MNEDCMLTTIDNPFDPFEHFDSWLLFDKEQGYNTCEYLARVAILTDDMSEQEREEAMEKAMDEIVMMNPLNIYKKITKQTTPH